MRFNLWLWQFGRVNLCFGKLSGAGTEDSRTDLQADNYSRAVEFGERCLWTVWKTTKGADTGDCRVCKDLPC